MKPFTLFIMITICAAIAVVRPSASGAEPFSYLPPGELAGESWRGREDYNVYLPGMRFPVEKAPAWANSQMYGNGGLWGPGGHECDEVNYSYPWQDTFCERRDSERYNPLCPDWGHQGQDIRPPTCEDSKHWAVAVEAGTITNIGPISVYQMGDSDIRHRYLHLNMGQLAVRVGDHVVAGDRIGLISDTSSGGTTYHLHFDMYSGAWYISPYMSLVRSYEELLGIDLNPGIDERWWLIMTY